MDPILIAIGAWCLLAVIARLAHRLRTETARADRAVEDARLAWRDREIERERHAEPRGLNLHPDDALPDVARGAGWLDSRP